MSIVIGDRDRLAIEVVHFKSPFCGLALYLAGERIGDPTMYAPAGAMVLALRSFRSSADRRCNPEYFRMPVELLLNEVHEGAFGSASGSLSEISARSRFLAPFILSPNRCESLDEFLIIVVTNDNQEKVIARKFGEVRVVESMLKLGEFDSLLDSAIERIQSFGQP